MEVLLFLVRLFAKAWWWALQDALLVCGFYNYRR